MPTTVREATPADDAETGELRVRAYAKRYAEKMPDHVVTEGRWADLRNVAASRAAGTVLVAEDAGRVVATVTLYRPGAADNESWIAGAADLRYLAIDPDLQGRGLSAIVMDAAESLVWSWGCETICLHVRPEAPGIARLYASRGYLRDPAGDFTVPRGNVPLEGWQKTRGR